MKLFLLIIVLFGVIFTFTAPQAEEHPLGMPNIVFCRAFVKKVSSKMSKMPISYQNFIKLTDGEGMPIQNDKRHWDGKNSSFHPQKLWVTAGSGRFPSV